MLGGDLGNCEAPEIHDRVAHAATRYARLAGTIEGARNLLRRNALSYPRITAPCLDRFRGASLVALSPGGLAREFDVYPFDGLSRRTLGGIVFEITRDNTSAGIDLVREAGLAPRARPDDSHQPAGRYFPLAGRDVLPIRDHHGNPIALAGRRAGQADGPKWLNSANSAAFTKSAALYGIDRLTEYMMRAGEHPEVVLVEGYLDAIAINATSPLTGIVAVSPMGTAVTDRHATALARLGLHRVGLFFDADAAGGSATDRAADTLRGHRLRSYPVRWGKADPDELVVKHGPRKLAAAIHAAAQHSTDRGMAAVRAAAARL